MHCVVQPYSGEICGHCPGTRREPRHKCFLGNHACIYWEHLFFGKQAVARGICVLRPRCACGAVGVRVSLAPLSGTAAGIEWLQSGDSLGSLQPCGAAELRGSAARAGDEQRSTRSGPPSGTCGSHGEGVVSVATKAGQRHNLSCSVPGKFCTHFFSKAGKRASCCSRLKWLSLCSQAWYRNSSSKVTALACIFLS